MPTYEYHCDTCDKNFDVVQAFSDEPLTECPTCGSPVRKVFGSVGIVFKGSGFYKTDSRDGKPRAGGDKAEKVAEGKADSAGSGSTTATSDTGKPSANGKSSSSDGAGAGSSEKGGASSEKKEKAGASSTGSSKRS